LERESDFCAVERAAGGIDARFGRTVADGPFADRQAMNESRMPAGNGARFAAVDIRTSQVDDVARAGGDRYASAAGRQHPRGALLR
jgi:hypothetical protein